MPKNFEDHLLDYLDDAYSIEQQALAQLRKAPAVARERTLAEHFRSHFAETERQAERIRERLEAHGRSPSRIKKAVMRLGGKAELLFARVQPDTPGKLVAHAFSFEAFEWAAYEMLLRMAERAGDPATVAAARTNRDEELAMMQRLGRDFDTAAAASIVGMDDDAVRDALGSYLADAHALEAQSDALLGQAREITGDGSLARLYAAHQAQSREHSRLLEERLRALGARPSLVKDAALRLGGFNWSLFFRAQPDTPAKLAVFVYAVEHLEIAGYELLRRVAAVARSEETVGLAERIAGEERAMAERVAGAFDLALEASLVGEGVPAAPVRG